ncbi:NAD(P)-dependent oxidoreductase [candidate division WOR-3 bacterium]|nr:NAD(P)-dependent oxidoreductase [candidate division WOR-3 bacterium]
MKGKKKVLVTGASGLLGSHVCEALHEAGYEVHALIRETSSRQWLKHDWLRIHTADVTDRKALATILMDMDYVIHTVRFTEGKNLRKRNVELVTMLCEECIKAGVERLVYSSSLAAGGPGRSQEPRSEADPDRPVTYYGIRKKDAEQILENFKQNLHVISLRYSVIYGPRDTHAFSLFKSMKTGIIPVVSRKPIYSSVIYVEDAARAAVAALTGKVASGSIYQITDGETLTVDRFYDYIEEAIGGEKKSKRVRVPFHAAMLGSWILHYIFRVSEIFPDRVRQFKANYWAASPAKAIRELGWKPLTNIREGLARTVIWYREHGWLP